MAPRRNLGNLGVVSAVVFLGEGMTVRDAFGAIRIGSSVLYFAIADRRSPIADRRSPTAHATAYAIAADQDAPASGGRGCPGPEPILTGPDQVLISMPGQAVARTGQSSAASSAATATSAASAAGSTAGSLGIIGSCPSDSYRLITRGSI